MIKHHHRVALYLGWLAGGLAMLGAHIFGASGWPITAAVGLTSFAVTLAVEPAPRRPCHAVVFGLNWETIDKMARDIPLALQALTYVIRLHADLTSEHGAPTLGTQNQVVYFILADPELSRAVATWAAMLNIGEASTKPYQRLPHDELYRRVREYLEKISSRPGQLFPGPRGAVGRL